MNPFILLGIAPATSLAQAAEAKDDAVFDGRLDTASADEAMRVLSDPRLRLAAEMDWPLDAGDLTNPAQRGELERDIKAIGGTASPFAKVLLVSRAIAEGRLAVDLELIAELDRLWPQVKPDYLTRLIDDERRKAGVAATSLEAVSAALVEMRGESARSVIAALGVPGRAGPVLTSAVERAIRANGPGNFVADLVSRHDANSEDAQNAIEKEIGQIEETARSAPSHAETVLPALTDALRRWDDISQPAQLIEQFRGHEEQRSLALGRRLRNFAVDMTNEHSQPVFSAAVVRMLLETFPELEGLAAQLRKDQETLAPLLVAHAASLRKQAPPPSATTQRSANSRPGAMPAAAPSGRTPATRRARFPAWLLIGLLVLGIKLFNGFMETGSHKPSTSYSPPSASIRPSLRTTTTTVPATPATTPSVKQAPLVPRKPAVGTGHILAADEISWCLGLSGVITALQAMDLSNPMIDQANALVSDCNSRCSDFRYQQSEMDRAQAAQNPAQAQTDALRLVTAWRAVSQPRITPAAPEPPIDETMLLGCIQQREVLALVGPKVRPDAAAHLRAAIASHEAACGNLLAKALSSDRAAQLDPAAAYREAQKMLESFGYDAAAIGATPADALTKALMDAGIPPRTDLPDPFDLRDPAAARAVQVRLRDLGLLRESAVDGRFGRASVAALKKFKANRGYPVNDVWDYPTQQELFR